MTEYAVGLVYRHIPSAVLFKCVGKSGESVYFRRVSKKFQEMMKEPVIGYTLEQADGRFNQYFRRKAKADSRYSPTMGRT